MAENPPTMHQPLVLVNTSEDWQPLHNSTDRRVISITLFSVQAGARRDGTVLLQDCKAGSRKWPLLLACACAEHASSAKTAAALINQHFNGDFCPIMMFTRRRTKGR
jgi:hypothetical protein